MEHGMEVSMDRGQALAAFENGLTFARDRVEAVGDPAAREAIACLIDALEGLRALVDEVEASVPSDWND